MITYKYYKFENKESVPSIWPDSVNVDEVGLIKETDPVYDENGNVIQPATYKDGWHVNVCYQGDVDLSFIQQYEINVGNPKRIWFGQQI
jgi:hypothetical protein